MKKCTKCGEISSDFYKHRKNKDGLQSECRECRSELHKKYNRSQNGLIVNMYNHQKSRSKKRGHSTPEYSLKELREWIFKQDNFKKLYDDWVVSGYETMKKPSVDRLDDSKGYSFDNIRLVTWEENHTKLSKRISQFDLNGNKLAEYNSIAEAQRKTGIAKGNIGWCCKGFHKTIGGYKWAYSE